jgi:hypothetical protein
MQHYFRHVRRANSKIYVSMCLRCGKAIAWSPRPALLTVADLAHGRRAHTAEDTPELIKERVEVADADAKFRGQAARSSVITIRHSIARPYAQAC